MMRCAGGGQGLGAGQGVELRDLQPAACCAAQAEARESGQAPSAAADEAAAAGPGPDPVLRSQLARPTQVAKDEGSITLTVARAAWLAGDTEDTVRLIRVSRVTRAASR